MVSFTLTSALSTGNGLSTAGGLAASGGLFGSGSSGGSGGGGGGGFDPAASAYFTAVVSAGGSVSTARKTLYNNLFLSLRAISSDLSKFNRLWIFAAENTQSALLDLVRLQTATAVLAPTFTVDRGYTMNSPGGQYVDTGYTPATSSPTTLQNSAFLAAYTNVVGSSGASGVGTPAGTFPQMEMVAPFTDGQFHAQINDSGFGGSAFGSGLTTGLFLADRIDANNVVLALNGSDLGTSVDTSTGIPTGNSIHIGDANPVETESRFAMTAIGVSLGSSGRANFSSAITTYLTAVGAN